MPSPFLAFDQRVDMFLSNVLFKGGSGKKRGGGKKKKKQLSQYGIRIKLKLFWQLVDLRFRILNSIWVRCTVVYCSKKYCIVYRCLCPPWARGTTL